MSVDQQTKRWPGSPDRAYPEVFTTIPVNQPKEKKPGQLTGQQLKQYFQDGFVQVDEFFKPEELDPVREATAELVDKLAQKLYDAGRIKKLYREYDLFNRLAMLEKDYPGTNVILHRVGRLPPAYRDLFANDRILNVMEQLLGTRDIQGNGVWNLRTKVPNNDASTVPWHQDSGYLDNTSYDVMVVTAWIPMLDSNERNGCLQMVRGGHRKGQMATHTGCWRDTWYVTLDDDEMEKTLGVDLKKDVVTCPVPYGGVLFFSNIIPHRSLNNTSDDIRWSLDLRWNRMEDHVDCRKPGIQLSSSQPDFEIDWEPFDAVSRQDVRHVNAGLEVDELSTLLQGPWMKKWEIVNTNKHTDEFERVEAAMAAVAAAGETVP